MAFWKALTNSLIVSSVVAFSVVFFSTLAGWLAGWLAGFAFAKPRFRGPGPLMIFVVAILAVPTQSGVIPLLIVMAKLGWTGSIAAVIVPGLVTACGVFFKRPYLVEALPDDLIEAPRMDGCSMIRTFRHVVLPAARSAAAILGMFTFMATWTDFFWPLIVLPASNPTVQIALQQLQSGFYVDFSLVLAGACSRRCRC